MQEQFSDILTAKNNKSGVLRPNINKEIVEKIKMTSKGKVVFNVSIKNGLLNLEQVEISK